MASTYNKDEEAGVTNPAAGEDPPAYQPDYGTTDNVPPSYEDRAPIDPPPSYESLYGNLKAAKQGSTGFLDFMKKFFVIVLGTSRLRGHSCTMRPFAVSVGCTILVGLVLAIPISMIVIGSVYLHDCPAEKYIPIYLIVAGVFGVIKNLSNMIQRIKNRQEENDDENAKTNPVDGIISCFLFAWFIAGNVWIYGTYNDWTDDKSSDDYCHPVLYWYAFWITTATYIIIALTCCCCVCVGGVLGLCCGDSN